MASTRTLTATDPLTGQTVIRRTARTYHGAIVWSGTNGALHVYGWAGRPDLAEATLKKVHRAGVTDARLAPVTADPWAAVEPVAPAPAPVAQGPGPELPTVASIRAGAGDAWAGQTWDPGTPEARARVALQGERVATLWPVAQALTGAGVTLPASWAGDGPVMAGEWPYDRALAALPLGAIAAAAAALAALPPVTRAQARALELCRGQFPTG